MNKLLVGLMGMAVAGAAFAKLPPPSPEAQAKAAEAKHKSAWSAKVAAFKLCEAQNKVAKQFGKNNASLAGCEDPGPYVPPQAQAQAAAPQAQEKK